jgi:hypothetical protein
MIIKKIIIAGANRRIIAETVAGEMIQDTALKAQKAANLKLTSIFETTGNVSS